MLVGLYGKGRQETKETAQDAVRVCGKSGRNSLKVGASYFSLQSSLATTRSSYFEGGNFCCREECIVQIINIIVVSFFSLSDLGVSSNLIGLLSQNNIEY